MIGEAKSGDGALRQSDSLLPLFMSIDFYLFIYVSPIYSMYRQSLMLFVFNYSFFVIINLLISLTTTQ